MTTQYSLPELPYDYRALMPHISEEQLMIHHQKHHQTYVDKANKILSELYEARKNDSLPDMTSKLKSLSFNVGGHVLHSIFWKNLSPESDGKPVGSLEEALERDFGGFKRFQEEFTAAATTVEGSGWAALVYCSKREQLMLSQIEKHNTNLHPQFEILMVLDMWEHAYYLDRKNQKADFVKAFWNIVNWEGINRKFETLI